MPHIVVKMIEGRSEELKQKLAQALYKTTADTLGLEEKYVSISIEDYSSSQWGTVHEEEIENKPDTLYIKPKY